MSTNDTIVALSSAPGTAGVAVLRLSGPDAWAAALAIFTPVRGGALRAGRVRLGTVQDAQGEVLDRCLLLPFKGPESYTGEDVAEFHLHGSPWVVEQVLERLGRSCRAAEPGEFTRRALLNGKLDVAQAEGVRALIESRSRLAHRLASRALAGDTTRKVEELRGLLVDLLSRIEAELDFSHEEIDPAPAASLLAWLAPVQARLGRWLASYRIGRLAHGAEVVLAGAPNAGKSTLMNALLEEDRVIVAATPGTTRDAVSQDCHIGSLLVRLWDTAGLRETDDPVERDGIGRSERRMADADLVLYLSAPGDPPPWRLPADVPLLRVYSKADLSAAPAGELAVSATTGQGLAELRAAIEATLLGDPLDPEDLVVSQLRHRQLLERALEALGRAEEGLNTNLDRSLVATDLRDAAEALGAIHGGFDVEQVLDGIFAKFCIGK